MAAHLWVDTYADPYTVNAKKPNAEALAISKAKKILKKLGPTVVESNHANPNASGTG